MGVSCKGSEGVRRIDVLGGRGGGRVMSRVGESRGSVTKGPVR